jgi:hypothetical protein
MGPVGYTLPEEACIKAITQELIHWPDMEAVAELMGMPNLTELVTMIAGGCSKEATTLVRSFIRQWAEKEAEKLFNQPRGNDG